MNNDLISRSELKKAIKDNGYSHYFEIFDIIDNAPTVDLKNIYQGGYYNGYLEGYLGGYTKAINEERPHGEWLHKEIDPFLKVYGQCSNCLQRERIGHFCRNCGADMRKGGAEECLEHII